MHRTSLAVVAVLVATAGLVSLPFEALGAGVSPAVHTGIWSWAVDNKPTVASFVPDSKHQYTSVAGGSVTINRSFQGAYEAILPVAQADDPLSVHVSALGSGSTECDIHEVTTQAGGGDDADVDIDCFDHAGDLVDSRFIVNLMQPSNTTTAHIGFVEQPTSSLGSGIPANSYNYNGYQNDIVGVSQPG